MHCFSCNAEYALGAGERIGFHDDCEHCHAALHVCRSCVHYDAQAYNHCHESSAERVADPERANRCEYFRPGDGAGGDGGATRAGALDDLEALFKKP